MRWATAGVVDRTAGLKPYESISVRSFSYLVTFRLLCAQERLLELEHKLINSNSSRWASWTEADDKELRYCLKDYCCSGIPCCADAMALKKDSLKWARTDYGKATLEFANRWATTDRGREYTPPTEAVHDYVDIPARQFSSVAKFLSIYLPTSIAHGRRARQAEAFLTALYPGSYPH
jgi:hypothetical protein